MKRITLFYSLIILLFITGPASAAAANESLEAAHYIEKLDKINFLPDLLPVAIDNSDTIELTDTQLEKLLAWRKANSQHLLDTRNKILQKKIEIKQAALSPHISSARLIQIQNQTFRLQRALLEYKLSCRELVINTFNRKNWEGFFMVLADKDIGVALPEYTVSQR